ncbi:MAG: hypothetical protein AAGF95_07060 [Chloroflexota bacterium]
MKLLRHAPALLVVLTLAILNPLACLIHCAVVGHARAIARDTSYSHRFFCDLSHVEYTESGETPRSPVPIPRAFYEFIPVAIVLLLLQSGRIVTLLPSRRPTFSQMFFTPPTPPPRFI